MCVLIHVAEKATVHLDVMLIARSYISTVCSFIQASGKVVEHCDMTAQSDRGDVCCDTCCREDD